MLNLGTTLLLFGWASLLSLVWAVVVYVWFRYTRANGMRFEISLVPALVLSPLFIIAGFGVADINLIFPAHTSMGVLDLIAYTVLPASVLFFASGLAFDIFTQVRREHRDLRGKQFYLFAKAMGQPVDRQVSRIVIPRGIVAAWVRCLPWFFGELVVVEAVFNAPGLGYHSWMYARMRSLDNLSESVAWLVGLYVILALGAAAYSKWIGRRLENYT